MYDIIGDIHGHAEKLEALLIKMGYRKRQGVYRHTERTAIFVGDLIDRGPHQRASVEIVQRMCDKGFAQCILGNHELNAVGWATKDNFGRYLRIHSVKNRDQHDAFLRVAEADPVWWAETIAWFKSLPLYIELPEFRVVHACWHRSSLQVLDEHSTNAVLHPDAWVKAFEKGHELFNSIEALCKGWEVPLPAGSSFLDKDGNSRNRIRTKWWASETPTYRSLALGLDDLACLPTKNVPKEGIPGYDQKKPLFIGHYWMMGNPYLLSETICCVDWSVADGGKLVGYRFDGPPLSQSHFWLV